MSIVFLQKFDVLISKLKIPHVLKTFVESTENQKSLLKRIVTEENIEDSSIQVFIRLPVGVSERDLVDVSEKSGIHKLIQNS